MLELERNLSEILEWSEKSGMKVNQKNSEIMVMKKNKNKVENFAVLLDIPVVNTYKQIGAILDNSCTLKSLYERLKSKSKGFCKDISKFCPYLISCISTGTVFSTKTSLDGVVTWNKSGNAVYNTSFRGFF